ncbi:MAG: sulfatase-like hydrolase/transferase [Deltaproteobacteria bacterium]|nr:sulfatase-like hydrolase/transferase [Deltaproteobacteria bacterium]
MNRRDFLKTASAVTLLGLTNSFAKAENKPSKRPNIIYIMTDDQSPFPIEKQKANQSRPFGFNGDRHVYTPVIDDLAKNGMIFTRAYVSSSVCSPSRYSTLTGRYAGRCQGPRFMRLHPKGTLTRVENNTELDENRPNLAKLLQSAGYRTGFIGKCHIIDHHLLGRAGIEGRDKNKFMTYEKSADPKDPEVTKAMTHNHNYWVNRIKEFGFDYVNSVYAANLRELFNDAANVHNVEWKNKAALDFIDQSGDQPFFLYYSETIPHGPAPWELRNGRYKYGLDADPKYTGQGYLDQEYPAMPERQQIKTEVKQKGKDPHHAWLRWFDHAVGSVVKKLKEKGKLENTLIVITSDHGNYNFGKATLYESGIKVPLLMYWPAEIKPDSVYNELVQNIDHAPTFLDLAGVKIDKSMEIDGVSLSKVLKGDKKPLHDHLFFEMGYARGVMTKDSKYIAVRYDEKTNRKIEKGFKFDGWQGRKLEFPYYVRNQHLGYHSGIYNENYFDKDQLYDLNNDPDEKNNISNSNTEKTEEMKKLLVEYLRSFPGRPYGEMVRSSN